MYVKSARFYDALYHFKDYGATSKQIHELLQQLHPSARTLLDVACGTGKHLEHLRNFYSAEGLDISSELLSVARRRCPDVQFHEGSMVDFQIGKQFDVITCLFSSIAYVKTSENLFTTIANMSKHLRLDGVIIIEPFFSLETYWTGTVTANFVNEPDLKIAWMYTSGVPKNDIVALDIHYLVGTPQGIDHFEERHELGLFSDEQWLEAFRNAGLNCIHDPKGFFGRGAYIGTHRFS